MSRCPLVLRPVIGQLVAAEILVRKEWRQPARRALHLIAVVAQVDAALALACEERGIRVNQVRQLWPTAGKKDLTSSARLAVH